MCYVCAMNVQNDRSYAKESTKTSPSGVRFDKEQLEFIQKKEPKLTTKQKVVDFLLNKFWWENKVSKPNHKGLPPDEPIYAAATPDAYDGKKMDRITHDEPAQWQEPKSAITGLPPKAEIAGIGNADDFQDEILATTMSIELEAVMKRVKTALLPFSAKQRLEAIAKEHSKDFFTD